MKPTAAESFETLPIPRKDFPQLLAGNYRVYKNAAEYIVVAAPTALEALQGSGLTSVHKIEREGLDYITVLAPGAWKEPEEAISPASTVADVPVPALPPEAVAPDSDAPLSDNDVSKLLNN